MKSCFLPLALLCASILPAQVPTNTPSAAQTPAPAASGQLKPRGPEAVAQQDPTKVVAVIAGKQITAKEAASMLHVLPPDQLKKYESNLPAVLQQIYMSAQLAEQAEKSGLDQQSPVKEQLKLNRDQLLMQAYLNKVANAPSSTPAQDPQAYYNAHLSEFDKVKLSGIFVSFNAPGTPASNSTASRTEAQARDKAADIEKKLKAGGDFSTLARTDSDNQQAAARGGELGTYSMGDNSLPADLKAAIDKLQAGQISEPIHVPSGLLIIRLDSRNKLTFDQAKPEITQKVQAEKNQAAVKAEVDKYNIQVQDPEFFSLSGTMAPKIPSLQRPGDANNGPAGGSAPHR